MKKLLVVLAALVVSAAQAATIEWSGGGDGTSWFDGRNWKGGNVPTIADRAEFKTGDDVVVTLNPSAESDGIVDVYDLYLGNSGSRSITLNGTPGAVLRTNKNPDGFWSYITCSSNGKLVLNVPVINKTDKGWTLYNRGTTEVYFNAVMTNMSVNGSGMGLTGGLNYFGRGSGLKSSIEGGDIGFASGSATYDPGPRGLYLLTEDAFLRSRKITFGAYLETVSSDFVQDGDETAVETSGHFELGYDSNNASQQFPEIEHVYELKRGTLTVGGNMLIGCNSRGVYRQSGGTATVAGNLRFTNYGGSSGSFDVTGGSFLVGGQVQCDNATRFTMSLKDCTFGVGANTDIKMPLKLAGTVTFDVPSGVALKLCRVSAEPGTKIVKSGEGSINFLADGDCELDLGEGSLDLGWLTIGENGATDFALLGGTCNATFCEFKGNAGGRGSFTVAGATFRAANNISLTGKGYRMSLSDCTFAIGANTTVDIDANLAGTVTFEIPSGVELGFTGNVAMSEDVKIVVTGGGTLKFAHDLVWRGDVDVRNGTFCFGTGSTYENADGDESVRRIDIRANGCFKVENYAAEVTSPRDVYIEDGGYVSIGNRSMFPVRHLYTNGVRVARGQCQNSADGLLRGGSGVMPIPYVWTGKGDSLNWMDANNWEDNERPGASVQTSPLKTGTSAQYSYVDFSAATNVIQNNSGGGVQTIGGIIFNPNSGPKTLVLKPATKTTGARNAIRFTRGQYQPCCFVGRGRELIFDDINIRQEGSQDWAFHGRGTYRIRGQQNLFETDAGKWSFYNRNIMPMAHVVFEQMTNTVELAVKDMAFCAIRDYNYGYSDVEFGADAVFYVNDLVWGKAGFDTVPFFRQSAGSYFSPNRMFLTLTTSAWGLRAYLLEGGELAVREALYLGSMYADTKDYPQNQGGDFRMTGGVLRAPLIGCENNQNWFYLNGGDAYVGAGGFVKTKATRSDASWYKFTENATPAVQWGGTTIHADADFTCGLDVALTGVGGDAKLDTAGHDVTFAGTVSGAGALVKTGEGALVLDGDVSGIALRVTGDISVAAGASVHVREFHLNGVRRTGTVQCGDGVVVVDAAADPWLDGASDAETFTANCANAKTLSSLVYSCAVSEAGTLTVAGSGSLTFEADASIYVRAGDTLVIKVPVSLAGDLTVCGGGTVVFTQGGVLSLAGGATAATVLVTDGGVCSVGTEVNGGAAGISFYAMTPSGVAQRTKLQIAAGGYLCQKNSPTTGNGAGIGGELEVLAGGTFAFSAAGAAFGGDRNRPETIRVSGGTLSVADQLTLTSGLVGGSRLILDSATLVVRSGSALVLPTMPVELSGTLTVETCDAAQFVTLNSAFAGSGSFRKTGPGAVYLACDLGAFAAFEVAEGSVVLDAAGSPTVSSGSLVSLASGSKLQLDADGTITIRELDVDGKQRLKGLYGEGVSPKAKYPAPVYGRGFLNVLTGEAPGALILVR